MKEEMREPFEAWHNTEGKTAIESEQYYEDVAKDYAFYAWQHQQAKIDSLQQEIERLRQPISDVKAREILHTLWDKSGGDYTFKDRADAIRSILERK